MAFQYDHSANFGRGLSSKSKLKGAPRSLSAILTDVQSGVPLAQVKLRQHAGSETKRIGVSYYTFTGTKLGKVNGPWRPGNVWKADIYDVKPEFRAAWDAGLITTRQRRQISPEFDRVVSALCLGESNDVDPSLYTSSDCLGYRYGSKREAVEALHATLSAK